MHCVLGKEIYNTHDKDVSNGLDASSEVSQEGTIIPDVDDERDVEEETCLELEDEVEVKHDKDVAHEIEVEDEKDESQTLGKPFTLYVDVGLQAQLSGESWGYADLDAGSQMFDQYIKINDENNLKLVIRSINWDAGHEIRESMWCKMCRQQLKAGTNDIYGELEKDFFGKNRPVGEIHIPSFVDINHISDFHLNREGSLIVRKVMYVIEHTNPDITYCPFLYNIVSLFCHYMSPSECYNCVYAMLHAKDMKYFPQTKVAVEATKLVLHDLTKKYAKSAFVSLVRSCTNVESVFDTWMWWILQDLPFPYIVRVIDCYLMEGIKVFYRVILAILILYVKHLGRRSQRTRVETASTVNKIRQFCQEIHRKVKVDKFLKVGFSIRGLSRKELRKLQVKHEMYINSRSLITSHELSNSSSGTNLKVSRSFSGHIALQNVQSNVLTTDMLYTLWTWLPTRFAVCQPELLFTSEEHGTSLMTLYSKVEHYQPTLIVIKTTNDEIFGAFCSSSWHNRKQSSKNLSYFGTGETFLFTLKPEKMKYEWVGLHQEDIPNTANMFLAGDNHVLTIGGGHGEAIQLDADMLHCRTEKCDTFQNKPLSSSEDFQCKVVEVYGFV
ncbi:hypothetical protein ACJMK2_018237 [Sinanodonta woodiana]|uniref:TLDc domain-containing protein n=1 Tax=Sinanodonta woodiana TaxID=1069815 RepID=A0ABD3UCV4_SINWO